MLERLQQLGRRALLRRPRVREPFDAVGVSVLRGGEAAARQPQLAHHVVEGLLRDYAVALLAGEQPRMEVGRHQERVVVEHLLEVRHEPLRVDGVAVEAAADEVVHPAGRHPVERQPHRLERATPQEELEHRGGRELRRVAEAAPARVEHARAGRARPRRGAPRSAARATARSRPSAAARRRAPRACAATSSGRSRYASATARSTCRNEGSPCRGSGGKYVPP